MATYEGIQTVSRVAGSAITVYRFVAFAAGDSKYDHVGTAQARMDGIAAESVAADGDVFPMVIPNGAIVKVVAGDAVSVGATVASDNQGRAITAVSGAGNWVAGIALTAASAAGEIIEIQFLRDQDQVT
jgi:hypothetical protein